MLVNNIGMLDVEDSIVVSTLSVLLYMIFVLVCLFVIWDG